MELSENGGAVEYTAGVDGTGAVGSGVGVACGVTVGVAVGIGVAVTVCSIIVVGLAWYDVDPVHPLNNKAIHKIPRIKIILGFINTPNSKKVFTSRYITLCIKGSVKLAGAGPRAKWLSKIGC